jgi:hypothetical protein
MQCPYGNVKQKFRSADSEHTANGLPVHSKNFMIHLVGFEVLTAVGVQILVLWVVVPCSLLVVF